MPYLLKSSPWWVGVLSFSSTLQSLAFLQRSSSLGGLLAAPHPFISFINLTVSPLANTPTTQTFSSFPDDFLIYIRNISSLQDHNSDCGPLASQHTNGPLFHMFDTLKVHNLYYDINCCKKSPA